MIDPAFRDDAVSVVPESTFELRRLDPPLHAAAQRRLDEDVVVHIAGGITVDGRLLSVNDDQTITIRDEKRQYDIALDAIGVIEGKKS